MSEIRKIKNELIDNIMRIRIMVNDVANNYLENDQYDEAQEIVTALNDLQDKVFKI